MSRIRTPRHFIYNEYDIMKEIQEPDKSHFVEEIMMEIRYIASLDDRRTRQLYGNFGFL